ncbi:MAG: mannose-1-phosphate guanylyltransferase/mannose-6-phosphate isomerase [Desulfuromonadales bacterium]|nr:mannose-1-phosphate guanylyltransferase/mannose-6-phosphate isomerase [Desulfuromonadales bacterium]
MRKVMIIPVILSGGAGTRLWPLSRELYPKQLLPLVGEHTMLQQTLLRLSGLAGLAPPVVVCNEEHRFIVAEQLRAIDCQAATILLEPIGKNTAPAVALAALHTLANQLDALLLVLPADHVIRDSATFCRAIATGVSFAEQGQLLTFGIVASRPESGYGYIKRGQPCSEPVADGSTVCQVEAFVEKPDTSLAEHYVRSGDYVWNSGMFLFRASRYLDELQRFQPEMLAACRLAFADRRADLDFLRIDAEAFARCPADSIDYAVMEKTDQALVVPLDAGWSDVGSFASLWEATDQDSCGNALFGDVIEVECNNSYLHAGSRLVTAVGLDGLIVIETADAVLITTKDRAQDVKQIVERLKAQDRTERLLHRRVNRPWGAYEGLDSGDGFLVKRITVNPGERLSLQRHRYRAEHWVVVRGTARITRNDEIVECQANQSFYIPIGDLHRLENPGKDLLEIIEVQTGNLLSEDDIERVDDHYGR